MFSAHRCHISNFQVESTLTRKLKLCTMRQSHNHVAISYQLGAVAVFDWRAGACVCGAFDHQLAQGSSRGEMHLHNGMTSELHTRLRVHIQLMA